MGYYTLGSYCLVVTQTNHCSGVPYAQMPNAQLPNLIYSPKNVRNICSHTSPYGHLYYTGNG